MIFSKEYSDYKELFEEYLLVELRNLQSRDKKLKEAIKYAITTGGKRLRPVMFLQIYDSLLTEKKIPQMMRMPVINEEKFTFTPGIIKVAETSQSDKHPTYIRLIACAIEMLHTYTLIHDDLPCLDNDDMRRGQPSCHARFSEATALLAGDALLSYSNELLLKAAVLNPQILVPILIFSSFCGASGLVGAQSAELQYSESDTTSDTLFDLTLKDELLTKKMGIPIIENIPFLIPKYMQRLVTESQKRLLDIYDGKTASLFVALAKLAISCATINGERASAVEIYAKCYGMAFQLKDDLSDMNETSYAYIFGKEKAEGLVKMYQEIAVAAARFLKNDFLEKLVDYESNIKNGRNLIKIR